MQLSRGDRDSFRRAYARASPEFARGALEDGEIEGFEDGCGPEYWDEVCKWILAVKRGGVAWRQGELRERIGGRGGTIIDGCAVGVGVEAAPVWKDAEGDEGGWVVEEIVIVRLDREVWM